MESASDVRLRGLVLMRWVRDRIDHDYVQLLDVPALARASDWGGYAGYFADLNGFLWNVGTAS